MWVWPYFNNMQRMFILFILIFVTSLAHASPLSKKDQQDYQQCSDLIQTSPANALTKATQWVKSDGSVASYHCKARAEFAVKRYGNAASTLTQLHALLGKDSTIRNSIRQQSSRAWRLAGEHRKAEQIITPHLQSLLATSAPHSDIADALLERSRIYRATARLLHALQDLDHALTLDISSRDILLERARLYVNMNEHALAKQDVQTVLRYNPTDKTAQKFMATLSLN